MSDFLENLLILFGLFVIINAIVFAIAYGIEHVYVPTCQPMTEDICTEQGKKDRLAHCEDKYVSSSCIDLLLKEVQLLCK